MHRCLLLLAFALLAAAPPLAGQSQVVGVRDLAFGAVIRGVQTIVLPSDPVRSGRFYISYVPGGRVQVRFTLPSSLTRVGGGGAMQITFRNGDGIIQGTAPGSVPESFNPNATSNVYLLNPNPDANIWLGGRVSPTATQAAGSYVGTVVMSVTFF